MSEFTTASLEALFAAGNFPATFDDLEPSASELHELEAVSDLIDAEVSAVDAECALLAAVDRLASARARVWVFRAVSDQGLL